MVTAAVLWAAPALAQTGTITGAVRDAATHAPIVTAVVACAEDGSNCDRASITDASGTYIARVSPGTYYVYTVGFVSGAAYADEIFGNILCPGDCSFGTARQSGTPVVVTANGTMRADFDLDPGGTIGGTVTDARTSEPLADVHVIVYSVLDGEPVGFGTDRTDGSGRYLIEGLPTGRYYAHTQNIPAANYVNEIYDNIACDRYCEGADVVRG